jgi:hypothetical protein
MHNTIATISAVEPEDLLREINAEKVDFHDEPLTSGWVRWCPPRERRVHLSKFWRLDSEKIRFISDFQIA